MHLRPSSQAQVRFHDNFDAWHRDERQDFKRARWGGCSDGQVCTQALALWFLWH